MRLVEQWTAIQEGLDPRWRDARLDLALDDEAHASRALALLGPAVPGRAGRAIRFFATRGGAAGVGPEAVRRLLQRLDQERIGGTLQLVSSDEAHSSKRTLPGLWPRSRRNAP